MRLILALALLVVGLADGRAAPAVRLERIGEYRSGYPAGDEIVGVQSATRRAVVCNGGAGTVDSGAPKFRRT